MLSTRVPTGPRHPTDEVELHEVSPQFTVVLVDDVSAEGARVFDRPNTPAVLTETSAQTRTQALRTSQKQVLRTSHLRKTTE